MTTSEFQQRETFLLETMLSALDARETARSAGAPMLVYLAEMLVQRAREDLQTIRGALEATGDARTSN